MKTTKAKRDASNRWNEKTKARKYYLAKRSMARSYCRVATKEDLEALLAFANEKTSRTLPRVNKNPIIANKNALHDCKTQRTVLAVNDQRYHSKSDLGTYGDPELFYTTKKGRSSICVRSRFK